MTCFLRAAAGNALTIVLAGLAATFTSLPNMFLTPAFVAGFMRVLIRHNPGILKTPVFFTSFAAISTKDLSRSELAFCFKPCSSANFFVICPLVMTLAAVPLFMDFMGGSILRRKAELQGWIVAKVK